VTGKNQNSEAAALLFTVPRIYNTLRNRTGNAELNVSYRLKNLKIVFHISIIV